MRASDLWQGKASIHTKKNTHNIKDILITQTKCQLNEVQPKCTKVGEKKTQKLKKFQEAGKN